MHFMRRWQIELPFETPFTLNHRTHWRVKAKRTAEIRAGAAEVIELAGVPPLAYLRAWIVYSPKDVRVRDPINLILTLKACEDALMDTGVVPDDNPLYVESVMPKIIRKNTEKRGFLWFVIEEAEWQVS